MALNFIADLLIDQGDDLGMGNHLKTLSRPTLGYWLAKTHTGRGLMTEAVKALIAAGFEHLGLNRIQARVPTGNWQSQAVCDRVGFRKEGVLRQTEWLYDHYIDLTMNALLKDEWKMEGQLKSAKSSGKYVRYCRVTPSFL